MEGNWRIKGRKLGGGGLKKCSNGKGIERISNVWRIVGGPFLRIILSS